MWNFCQVPRVATISEKKRMVILENKPREKVQVGPAKMWRKKNHLCHRLDYPFGEECHETDQQLEGTFPICCNYCELEKHKGNFKERKPS